MYQLSEQLFGAFKRYTLSDSDGKNSISFIAQRDAALLNLCLSGQELLDSYDTAEDFDYNNWAKSNLLYPFPNRLEDGFYQWKDKDYYFPINDPNTLNAIHGFEHQLEMQIISQDQDHKNGLLMMEAYYDGALEHYPWPFKLEISYQLTAGAFSIHFKLTNQANEAIPLGFGWHPYFRLGDQIGEHALQLPEVDWVGVNGRMIPTGKRYSYEEFANKKRINSTILDNCFAIKQQEGKAEVLLQLGNKQLKYWQDCGPRQFNYLQVFTPPSRNCIALEPMSCNVNAFNNQEGLLELAPDECFEASVGVVFTG